MMTVNAATGGHAGPEGVAGEKRTREVLSAQAMHRMLRRMAVAIVEQNERLDQLVLVGIRTRGLPLAERLAEHIEQAEGVELPIGAVDITFYRDDLSVVGPQPEVGVTSLPCSIEDRIVVLCDDVLFTGRTVRAALDELNDYGRPSAVRLVVLIDRGWRELPIRADIVGQELQTERQARVEVGFAESDDADFVRVVDGGAG